MRWHNKPHSSVNSAWIEEWLTMWDQHKNLILVCIQMPDGEGIYKTAHYLSPF